MKIILVTVLLAATALNAAEQSRESFNRDWRFARFGPMPDRSTKPEPGGESWSITAAASSEETDKGNSAQMAVDGDPVCQDARADAEAALLVLESVVASARR